MPRAAGVLVRRHDGAQNIDVSSHKHPGGLTQFDAGTTCDEDRDAAIHRSNIFRRAP
jgi:hypothetical protein